MKIEEFLSSNPGRPFYVAEIGINHGGNYKKALHMIDMAESAGADAVKFQTVDADLVYPKDSELYQIFSRCSLKEEEWAALKKEAEDMDLVFFSTPGEEKSADLLERLGVELYKVASDRAADIAFVNYVMAKGKPVIVSTGQMGVPSHVEQVIARYSSLPLAILHCVSLYPTPLKRATLQRIGMLQYSPHFRNKVSIGYSDHVSGISASLAAWEQYRVPIIEKHFKVDNHCVDAAVSVDSDWFSLMVRTINSMRNLSSNDNPEELPIVFEELYEARH